MNTWTNITIINTWITNTHAGWIPNQNFINDLEKKRKKKKKRKRELKWKKKKNTCSLIVKIIGIKELTVCICNWNHCCWLLILFLFVLGLFCLLGCLIVCLFVLFCLFVCLFCLFVLFVCLFVWTVCLFVCLFDCLIVCFVCLFFFFILFVHFCLFSFHFLLLQKNFSTSAHKMEHNFEQQNKAQTLLTLNYVKSSMKIR